MRRPHSGRQLSWDHHGRCPSNRTSCEAFAARWYRGESRHRHGTRRFTQVLVPLCSRVKDLLLLLIIEGSVLSRGLAGLCITRVSACNLRLDEILGYESCVGG